jgi:hypothetical protein
MKVNMMLFLLLFTSIQLLFGQRSKMPTGIIYAKDFNFIRASCEDNYQLESPSYIRIYIKP